MAAQMYLVSDSLNQSTKYGNMDDSRLQALTEMLFNPINNVPTK